MNVYSHVAADENDEPSWVDVQAPVERFAPTGPQHVAMSAAGYAFSMAVAVTHVTEGGPAFLSPPAVCLSVLPSLSLSLAPAYASAVTSSGWDLTTTLSGIELF